MTYNWFKIFNLDEFNALGLTSRLYTLELMGVGVKEILVTKGNSVSILYDDVFLSLGLNDENPFAFDGHAVYEDDNGDVFLGIEVEEDEE